VRVLVVADGMYPPYTEITGNSGIYRLLKQLSQDGLEIHVVTFLEKWASPEWRFWVSNQSLAGGPIFHVLHNSLAQKMPKAVWKMSYISAIAALSKRRRYDVVHCYSSSLLTLGFAPIFKLFFRTCVAYTFCSPIGGFSGITFLPRVPLPIDLVFCTSKHLCRSVGRVLGNFRMKYLPLGVDLKRFHVRREEEVMAAKSKFGIPSDSIVVLFIGPMEPSKGVSTLLGTLPIIVREFPSVVYLVVATFQGHYFRDTDIAWFRERLRHVTMLKKEFPRNLMLLQGQQDVPALMQVADIFVSPFESEQGTLSLPLTLLEGMASELGVISSDVKGARELICDCRNGLLFPQGGCEELADRIRLLLKHPDLRASLGKQARKSVQEMDVRRVSRRLIREYEEMVSRISRA
jgi:glycosyltransferase involved in cell wall biosynthesis